MNMTGADLQDFANKSIDMMCHLPGRNNAEVYREISEYSGVSSSRIRDFHSGAHSNLTVETLDFIIVGVKKAMRKIAA